jgi:methylmalonyl-CoA epimerase
VPPQGIHHIGVAVSDLDLALETYERLFSAQLESRETMSSQGAEAAAIVVGESRVELLAPTGDDTPIGRFLARRGPGMHHVAYQVDDIASELARLDADGVDLVDREPRPGLYGLQVAFLHPDAVHGVLSELVCVD